MRNFQDTFKTRKQPFISDFSICLTVPLTSALLLTQVRRTKNEASTFQNYLTQRITMYITLKNCHKQTMHTLL